VNAEYAFDKEVFNNYFVHMRIVFPKGWKGQAYAPIVIFPHR
jgi:hypothetical protein